MSSRYHLPTVGSNNPCGFDSSQSHVLPSVSCGNEIVFQSVFGAHTSIAPTRIKLSDDHGGDQISDIRLVHGYSRNETLYIVSGEGKLYQVYGNNLKRVVIDNNENLEVLQIASYTDAVLFLVRDKSIDEYFIYGSGFNGYFRLTHKLSSDTVVDGIRIMFGPGKELPFIGIPYVINHIGCCFSFSCCVVNDTLLHFTGQKWLSHGKTETDGYFTWPNMIQDLKQPVTKLECGDFHVVALLKDGTVSVGGSNSSNQLSSLATNGNQAFVNIFSKISNVFSGSNSVLYQSKGMEELRFQLHGAKQFNFITTNDGKQMKYLDTHPTEVLEQQFTRDFFLHRYEENPEKFYLDGSSYYGSYPFANTELSLEKIVPFEEFNKGFYPPYKKSEFYRNVVKLILQPKGIFCICDYGSGLSSRIFTQLLKSTDYSCENNRLIFDTVIIAQQ